MDVRLVVLISGDLSRAGILNTPDGRAMARYVVARGIPGTFPLFKEMDVSLCRPNFTFSIPNALVEGNHRFAFGYDIRTPGSHVQQFGDLALPLRLLEIQLQTLERIT
jgi:hypothetical protein